MYAILESDRRRKSIRLQLQARLLFFWESPRNVHSRQTTLAYSSSYLILLLIEIVLNAHVVEYLSPLVTRTVDFLGVEVR